MMDFLKANVTIISLIVAVTALVQPWLITLWKKFFRSPKIEIYPSGNLEIGYSDYGPTIGLHGTLHAPHGDVFVKSIRLKVRRVQTNEEHWFAWAVFRSPVITFNPSESQPMELPAGFIVSQTQPHRYNIVFHDPDIQSEIRPYLEKLPPLAFSIGHKHNLDFVRGTINSQEIYYKTYDEYAQSTEVTNAYARFNTLCYWQTGRYKIEVHTDTNKKDSHFMKQLPFQLTEQDVERLRRNTVVMTENHFRIVAGEQFWSFNFAYPSIMES